MVAIKIFDKENIKQQNMSTSIKKEISSIFAIRGLTFNLRLATKYDQSPKCNQAEGSFSQQFQNILSTRAGRRRRLAGVTGYNEERV